MNSNEFYTKYLLFPELNTLDYFFDGGDCCLNETSSTCYKGVELCVKSEIGDGICQDYNNGKDL